MGIFFFVGILFAPQLACRCLSLFPRLDWPLGQLNDAASSHTLTVSVARHCKSSQMVPFISFFWVGGGDKFKKGKKQLSVMGMSLRIGLVIGYFH